ncbi:MAG: hypothetical protein E6470_17175 [Enterobacteriaceae bacterium]|nr:hypothetical protein [Enterobacteriaceae bacterium]
MNKQQFLEMLCKLQFKPVGIRVCKDTNYGMDKQTYSVWVCGRGSIDTTMVMGIDIYFIKRFHKEDAANIAAAKYQKWFEKYQQQEDA